MTEFIMALIGLAVGLFILAAIGHLIWLIAAAAITALFGERCPGCGNLLKNSICESCSAARQARAADNQSFDAIRDRLLIEAKEWLSLDELCQLDKLLDSIESRSGVRPENRSLTESPQETESEVAHAKAESHAPIDQGQSIITAELVPPVVIPAESADLDQAEAIAEPLAVTTDSIPHPAEQDSASVHALEQDYTFDSNSQSESLTAQVAPPKELVARTVEKTQQVQTKLTVELLTSFMEKSNIRWIELISGSLIVVCSVGLVISLWNTLSSTSRFFPSLIFLLATVAVHGAGQYTLRKWKLRTTSRGILQIALMLIPLAVLVGILLSQREGALPRLDLSTLTVIGLGTVVYSGLAVTAGASLYSKRGKLIAASTIVASLTLIPIHFFGKFDQLATANAALSLLPLLLIAMVNVIPLSKMSLRASGAAFRRIASIVLQCLFALLVVFAFWILQTKDQGLSHWWWIAMGVFAAVWVSWGWSVHNPIAWIGSVFNQPVSEVKVRDAAASWFELLAACIGVLSALLFLTAVAKSSSSLMQTCYLLLPAGVWWLYHGWRCNMRLSLTAGSLSVLLAVVFAIDHWVAHGEVVGTLAWLGLQRVITFSSVGIIAAIGTAVLIQTFGDRSRPAVPSRWSLQNDATATVTTMCASIQFAGCCLVVAAAALTLLASLVPLGPTPYGGNWAGSFLLLFGSAAIAISITQLRINVLSNLPRALLPIGQAVLTFAVFRLCQTSPILESVLGELRPARSWAVGFLLVAMLWSILAAVVRSMLPAHQQLKLKESLGHRWCIDCLAIGASTLLSIGLFPLLINSDHLLLATRLGWLIPASLACMFLAWRSSATREATFVSVVAYFGAILYNAGHAAQWWSFDTLLPIISIFALLVAALAAVWTTALYGMK